MSPKSTLLAKKRFLDVDLSEKCTETAILDNLIMQYELGKTSSQIPIYERLHNEVFQSLEKKRQYEKLSL